MGLVSTIYGSNQIRFESGKRKGKSKNQIALSIQYKKDKEYRDPELIKVLKEKIKTEAYFTKKNKLTKKQRKDKFLKRKY
jgi:hypothetical protein